jgi:hypothetical protein
VLRTGIQLSEFVAGACEVEAVMLGAGRSLINVDAVMLVDYEGRRDVADLARVHVIEGEGDTTTQWALLKTADGSCDLTEL